MTGEEFLEIFLDALKDSALVLAFVFLFHLLLSFIEDRLAKLLTHKRGLGPVLGSLFGVIPQCGTSVLAADLYSKRYITFGTIIAVFLSCSDEALIILLTSPNERTWYVIPLILSKVILGMGFGYLLDLLLKKQEIECPKEDIHDATCDGHHHENTKLHKHLIHPLIHSLEIFVFVFVINFALGIIIGFVGEEAFSSFLTSNKYLGPLFASIVGLVPNCVSSVLLTELFIGGHLSFGALLAGLLVNSGLGITLLLKKKTTLKKAFIILGVCFAIAIFAGYIACLIVGF